MRIDHEALRALPPEETTRERLQALGLAPVEGASEFHDNRILVPSQVMAVGSPSATASAVIQKDHHAGFYLLIDITVIGAGTVQPRLTLKSKANPARSVTLWTAAAALNANAAKAYLFYPQGLENGVSGGTAMPGNIGLNERVSLPQSGELTLDFIVAGGVVTMSAEMFGLAL